MSDSNSVYEVVNSITPNLENDRKFIAIFLDLAKPFDTVTYWTFQFIGKLSSFRET